MVLLTRSASSTLPRRHSSGGGIKINQPKTPTRCASTGTALPSVSQTQAVLRAVPTPCESLGSNPPPRKTPTSTALPVKTKTKGLRPVCDSNIISPLSSTSSNRFPSSSSPGGRSSMNVDTKITNAQTGETSSRKRRFSSGVSFYSDVIEKQRLQQRQPRIVHESSSEHPDSTKIHEMLVISVNIIRLTAALVLCLFVVICALFSSMYQIGMGYKNCLAN